ncbi:glycosyltransferase [Acetobacteraceae bacterium ESL0709]|nr:glycosyltransferase [Acetobacteraceae bacterium ESL0697]MDF7678881.1 glycosyltransferase [Acetobacteraceae bacterium ESL0709]
MFISFYNTFLAVTGAGLAQKNFCDLYEEPGRKLFRIATLSDLRNAGYLLERQHDGVTAFKQGQNYLSVSADLSLFSRDHVGGWERFLEVPEEKIPRALPLYPLGQSIPKVVHQIGLGVEQAGSFRENIAYMIRENGAYHHRLWGDRNSDNIIDFICYYYNRDIWDIFGKINSAYRAMQADFLRYLIIYALGGVYLDLKSIVTKPLDEVMRKGDSLLLAKWDAISEVHPDLVHIERGEYVNWFIASVAGHPLLRRVIHQVMCNIVFYDRRFAGAGRIGVLRTTGPVPYTRAIISACDTEKNFRELDLQKDGLLYVSPLIQRDYGSLYNGPHYSALDFDLITGNG